MLLFVAKFLKTQKTIIMLLPDNIHPENTVYFNGAYVLQVLQQRPLQTYLELYQNVKAIKNMAYSMFILCLDWLFLLNAAQINSQGEVELCS
ncbi:hypothetical protein HDE69_004289 [Pedobacter cryoconitis]|uniref:Uncharacterized protein n=2 Tax=Pedobacter cryoconitis TaxID=188932 RepID=A0A7W8YWN1_9SPHI|nr:hypothetical protein [Pedobacter cryoconitis]